jgi:hypothetical protein
VLNLKMYYSNALVLPPYPLEDAAKEIFLFPMAKICRNWKTKQTQKKIQSQSGRTSFKNEIIPTLSLNDRIQLQFRTWPLNT